MPITKLDGWISIIFLGIFGIAIIVGVLGLIFIVRESLRDWLGRKELRKELIESNKRLSKYL